MTPEDLRAMFADVLPEKPMASASVGSALVVARALMREAARLDRWSKHQGTEADCKAAPAREAAARMNALAAIKLVSSTVGAPS